MTPADHQISRQPPWQQIADDPFEMIERSECGFALCDRCPQNPRGDDVSILVNNGGHLPYTATDKAQFL